MLSLSKMRLCVVFALFSVVISMPHVPQEPQEKEPENMMLLDSDPQDIMMPDEEQLKQMFSDLFISSSRDARQLELDEDADDGEAGDAADVADVTADADNAVEAAVTSNSEAKASEEEVARFNNYIDAIYRRMNAALRAKMMDPMTLNLDDKQKKAKGGKKADFPRSLNKREAEEKDEEEDNCDDDDEEYDYNLEDDDTEKEEEIQARTGKAEKKKNKGAEARKNNKNKNKKAKKGKKGGKDARKEQINKKAEREAAKEKKQQLREKKREERKKNKEEKERSVSKREADDEEEEKEEDAILAEDELLDRAGKTARDAKKKRAGAAARKNKKNKKGKKEDKEDKATKRAEREAAKKEKQDKKQKKQELREKKRAEKKKEKAGASRRQSRSGQKNKNRKKQNNNKNNNKQKSRNTNNKKSKSSNNKSKKNSNNKARSGNARNNQKDEKMMGSLSGIATLRREGDVIVKEEENHKVITSEFNVGPLQLEVSKMYGKGQARTVKSAKAITEVMSGTMTLKVKPDGSAHVKKVVFKEPENVDVKGSLSDNKPRNLRYLKNSVNKMRPLAAIRVLKTARYVLKSPNSSMANKA